MSSDFAGKRRQPSSAKLLLFPSESSLVSAVLEGSQDARAVLFDRYATPVRRMLRKVLGPDQEIDDLLHETFVDAFSQIASLRDPTRVRSWLFAIAIYRARKVLRQRRRSIFDFLDTREELESVEHAQAADPQTRLIQQTYWVLSRMSEDERIVLILRFLDEHTVPEIAAECSWSEATVKRKIVRAKQMFLKIATRYPEVAERIHELVGGTGEVTP